MASIPYMANPVGPPWLPASVAEARKLSYWAQISAGLLTVLLLIIGIVRLIDKDGSTGISFIVGAVIALALFFLMKAMLFDVLDQGKFKEVSGKMLVLGIIGLVGGVIPGILIILGYIRLQEVFQPQYQQYTPRMRQSPHLRHRSSRHPRNTSRRTNPPSNRCRKTTRCRPCGMGSSRTRPWLSRRRRNRNPK
jgi:hypothetical protein